MSRLDDEKNHSHWKIHINNEHNATSRTSNGDSKESAIKYCKQLESERSPREVRLFKVTTTYEEIDINS